MTYSFALSSGQCRERLDGLDLPLRGQELDYESSVHCVWPSEATECSPEAVMDENTCCTLFDYIFNPVLFCVFQETLAFPPGVWVKPLQPLKGRGEHQAPDGALLEDELQVDGVEVEAVSQPGKCFTCPRSAVPQFTI